MAKFSNTQGISRIKFTQNVQCYCPLGDDWYTNHITVNMKLGDTVPDYCEIDDFIRSIAGQSLIIEDVINLIYTHLRDNYCPIELCVESYVDDAKHLAVTVTKEL